MGNNRTELNDWAALAEDEVHVWAVPLAESRGREGEFESRLTDEERRRADRFLRDEVRQRFVVARASLRSILGGYLEVPAVAVPIEEGTHGKPQLVGGNANDLRFNLAHSGELALVAVTRGCEVGVDVERLRSVEHWQELAARYFHPAEAAAIAAVDSAERNAAFLRCWTQKEAILKAFGVGLSHSLQTFAVPAIDCVGEWIEVPARDAAAPRRYWLQSVAASPGYIAAVATEMERCAAIRAIEN